MYCSICSICATYLLYRTCINKFKEAPKYDSTIILYLTHVLNKVAPYLNLIHVLKDIKVETERFETFHT